MGSSAEVGPGAIQWRAETRQDTRDVLICTAERLFAERGIGSVSLREIVIEAGQRNKSAANYHFGDKAGLIEAVFVHRMTPIDAERRRLLALLDDRGGGETLRDLLEILVCPFAEQLGRTGGKSWYARFIAQVALAGGQASFVAVRGEGLRLVIERLEQHLGRLPSVLREARVWRSFGLAVQAFAEQERNVSNGSNTVSTIQLTSQLVEEMEGLLLAPHSPPTARSDQ
jgi:AcrR family transcriptional regulator